MDTSEKHPHYNWDNEDDWQCGDCGTWYTQQVRFCQKPWLDKAHLRVWNKGLRKSPKEQRAEYPIYFATVEALEVFA